MDKITDYIDVVLEPWQIAQKAESVAQALALIEEKFNVVFKQIEFEVLDDEGYGANPFDEEEIPNDPEDEEE